jgi:alpha-L-glutamate ligase-like protein
MNRRNAACILDHNPRRLFPLVDDKLLMRDLCLRIGVPTPAVYAILPSHSRLRLLPGLLGDHEDFVLKPSCGSGGRGILVLIGRQGEKFVRHNGERIDQDEIRQHASNILSGMYSLGGRPDRAILQQRVRIHPALAPVAYKGIPDVRVVLYRHRPAMAMLRLPTQASGGRANLHQGGIGAGVELDSGRTIRAVQNNAMIERHPDTGADLHGVRIPFWSQILDMARGVSSAVGLGYIGVDIVIDAEQGPMLLEANARPGLAIQLANGRGLVPRLAEIDREVEASGGHPVYCLPHGEAPSDLRRRHPARWRRSA